MNQEKRYGFFSILIGLYGLASSIFFDLRLEAKIQEVGPVAALMEFFKYRDIEAYLLICLSLGGILIGIWPILKRRLWWSTIGLVMNLWNLVEVILHVGLPALLPFN